MKLMASSTSTPAAQGSGVGHFRSFRVACSRLLYQVVIEVSTKSGVHRLLHTVDIFTETKKKHSLSTTLFY